MVDNRRIIFNHINQETQALDRELEELEIENLRINARRAAIAVEQAEIRDKWDRVEKILYSGKIPEEYKHLIDAAIADQNIYW
ncbi:MAG: hypothetical protein ACR2MS_02595 [Weeksellaceae bacterium]